jgi:hypothetical protein
MSLVTLDVKKVGGEMEVKFTEPQVHEWSGLE